MMTHLVKIRVVTIAALCAAIALVGADTVAAQDVPRTFLCGGIEGFYIGSPDWRPQKDGYGNTSMLIQYNAGGAMSRITSIRDGKKIYEAEGFGIAMTTGFSVTVFGEQYTETYVVNVSNMELLHSAIRAGGATLPNAVKSFRGKCQPAGALAR